MKLTKSKYNTTFDFIKICFFLLVFLSFSLCSNAQIQPPAGIGNNIILWLSPDTAVYESTGNVAVIGDRVREWHDISGGGYIFTTTNNTTRPKYKNNYQGRNLLDFKDGRLLENTAIASIINGLSEFSIYIVIKSDDINTDQGFLNSLDPNGADEILGMRYDQNGANTGRSNLLKCGMQGNTPNNQIESQSNTQTNSLQVLTLTWKIGEKINLYIDGVLNESSVNNVGTVMSGVQKILLGKGAKDENTTEGWDGRIGTTIFYSEKMSPDSVSLIAGDLKSINSISSGDWNNSSTWDCNCNPPNNAFVTINNSHTVTLTQNETANNVIIKSGGNLDVSNNNYRLTLNRNFTNHGSFLARNGEVVFSGSEEQLIDGTANTTFHNLTVNNTNGVRIANSPINIENTLDIISGCFETSNSLTLLSNATRTARLAELSGSACINGDITMQRYVATTQATWKYFTSAVSGTTVADFNDDFITTGFTGADYPTFPTAAAPWASIYTYNESEPGVIDSGFVSATNISNPITVGQGFWSYIFGTTPYTVDVVGPPNVGNINLPVSYTNNGTPSEDGWSMVGNPYPSTIDWDSPNISKTNINAAIYIWNASQQQFASYVSGIGTNGGSKNIASSQAFWVQTNGPGPSLVVTEASKTVVDASFLKQSSIAPLRIKSKNSYGNDELVINFDGNASNSFDSSLDAKKIVSSNVNLPSMSSITNGREYSINQINPQEINIPIKILTGISGSHSISIENASLFSNNCLILEDLFTNTFYDLSIVDSFSTYIYDTTQTARFLLHVGAPLNIDPIDISCFGYNDAKIILTKNSSSSFDIIWKDNLGVVLATNTNVSFTDSLSNLSGGTYYVETTDLLCGNRTDTVFINEPSQITAQFSTNIDTVYLSQGGNINFINSSSNAISFLWDFDDSISSTLVSPIHQYTQSGNYNVSLYAYQTPNCFETVTKNITVLNNITSIQNLDLVNKPKVWINNNNLLITGKDISNIKVENLLGQLLFTSSNNIEEKQVFNLEQLSSQILIVTTLSNNKVSSNKVVFLSTNN